MAHERHGGVLNSGRLFFFSHIFPAFFIIPPFFLSFFSLSLSPHLATVIWKMTNTYSKPMDTSWLFTSLSQKKNMYGSIVLSVATVSAFLSYQRKTKGKHQQRQQQEENDDALFQSHKAFFPVVDNLQTKVGVNDEFKRQLRSLAVILFPNWHTKEAGLLVLHSIFLILRTYLSVVVARLDGRIVRDLVSSIGPRFMQRNEKDT